MALVGTILAVGCATPAGACADRLERQREQRQPNVVVVMADDMRADDLRFMPHVRRLIAARGLTFDDERLQVGTGGIDGSRQPCRS